MEVTKLNLNGNEYNFTDADAQSKINDIKASTYTKGEVDKALTDSLKDYAKSKDVADTYQPKGDYLTEHQNISHLATENEVKAVSDKVDAIKVPTKISELTNDSKYQTETQVNTAIQKVVGTAPEALDTLGEIADKLSDNDDVVAGLVNTLSTKADKSALNNYYKKAEVESKIAEGIDSIDLTPYETVECAADKYQPKGNYLTSHQSLASYLKVDGSNGTKDGASAIIRKLGDGDQTMTDNTLVITSYYSGQTTDNPLFYRRPANLLWNYIKGKTDALYLQEHQSLSGYLKAADAAKTYQPKGDYLTEHQDISNLATKDTNQDITGVKTFTNGFKINTTTSWEDNDRSIPFTYTNAPNLVRWYNQDENKGFTYNPATGAVKAGSFVKRGGTATQFLKADGSVDSTSYLPKSGGTLSGDIYVPHIRGCASPTNYLLGIKTSTSTASGIPEDNWFVGDYQRTGYIRSTGDLKHYNTTGTKTSTILDSDNYSKFNIPTIWTGTEAQYNALTTKDNNTLYLIPE